MATTLETEPQSPSASPPNPAAGTARVSERLRSLQLAAEERAGAGKGAFGRWAFRLGVLALLAGGGYWAQSSGQLDRWQQMYLLRTAPEVETLTVTREVPSDVQLDLSGYIVPHTKVNISPRVPGQVVIMNLLEGQVVKQGDLLAQIDDQSFQADYAQTQAALALAESRLDELKNGALPEEIEQARAAVDQAQSTYDLAKREADRFAQLEGTVSPSELDRIRGSVRDADANLRVLKQKLVLIEKGVREERIRAAEADVAQAKAMLEKSKYFLENAKIFAPITGTVLEKNAELGETLRPEVLLTNLCVLADLNQMEVEVDVQERDLNRIRIGQKCEVITDAYQDKKYQGVMERRQPMVNRQRGVVQVVIRVTDPDENLLPDMNCRVRFLQEKTETQGPDPIWLAADAVVQDEEQSVVYVVDGDTLRRRPVVTGETEGRSTVIKEGLQEGETVALPGAHKLIDGQKIRAKAE